MLRHGVELFDMPGIPALVSQGVGDVFDLNLLRFGSEQVDTLAGECLQSTHGFVLLLSSC
jgi:hypothetical protein